MGSCVFASSKAIGLKLYLGSWMVLVFFVLCTFGSISTERWVPESSANYYYSRSELLATSQALNDRSYLMLSEAANFNSP